MKTFAQILKENNIILSEEMHQELKDILDSPTTSIKGRNSKLNTFTGKVQDLAKRGEDNGLEDGRAKKGSSRAVFFPKEHDDITVDGIKTKQPTAVKIAFPGTLDKYHSSDRLLGQLQNENEADNYSRQSYSVLRHQPEKGEHHYATNPEGVLAPVLSNHEDHHWLKMGRANSITKGRFKKLTVTESHPNGLNFDHFTEALNNDYNAAHGQHSGIDKHDKVREHPLYEKTQNFINDTGQHPGDLRIQNYGEYSHPVTGEKSPVIRDYGYSNNNDIPKLYAEGFKNQRNAARNNHDGW